jgi:hypothetical protein
MLSEEGDGRLFYQTILPIGEEDVDVEVEYTVSKAHPDDAGYRPGAHYVHISDISRKDTKASVLHQLSQDEFYALEEKVLEHFHHYVR